MNLLKRSAQAIINTGWSISRALSGNENRPDAYRPTRAQYKSYKRNFAAADTNNLTHGWNTQTATVNHYLRSQITPLRARSREQIRNNPYAKRFRSLMRSNVVGPNGIQCQAQSVMNGKIDKLANDAIDNAWQDWGDNYAAADGMSSWIDLQRLAINTYAGDGEFIFEKVSGGRYGFQLKPIDPEQLDITRNQREHNGNVTILGVEYNKRQVAVRYWFREVDEWGNYNAGQPYSLPASSVYLCFPIEWVMQARGIPPLTASLFRMKMLDGYDDAALTAARVGASQMGFFTSSDGDSDVADDEDSDGNQVLEAEPGVFHQLPEGSTFEKFDPNYPHAQYQPFTKQNLRATSAGMDLNYNSLANDLEGVNFSSIRAGVLEDRELYKDVQNWFVRCFVRRVRIDWLKAALMRGEIKIGSRPLSRPVTDYYATNYQARRWAWVDPKNDMQANETAYRLKLRSLSSIIRDQGDRPDEVWNEIAKETEFLKGLGIEVNLNKSKPEPETDEDKDADEKQTNKEV